jgi:Ca2+-binding EF-hand superfamily protein
MKILTTLTILSSVLLIVVTPAAHAGGEGGRGKHAQKAHQRLKEADKDHDGRISRSEAEASMPRLAKNFDRIDADKDGFVTREEMRAFHEQQRAQRKGK